MKPTINKVLAVLSLMLIFCGSNSCQNRQLLTHHLVTSKKDIDGKVYEEWYQHQQKTSADSAVYVERSGKKTTIAWRPEQPARFIGGKDAFNFYVENNLKWPPLFDGEGRVVFNLFIDESGRLIEYRLLRGIAACEACTANAVELLESIDEWEPARKQGKAVSSSGAYSIPFKLYPTSK